MTDYRLVEYMGSPELGTPDPATKLTRAQRANLRKLADKLEALPRDYRHFDMAHFFQRSSSGDELRYCQGQHGLSSCGTVACALGHGPDAGIPFRPVDFDTSPWGKFPDWHKYSERFVPRECWEWAFAGVWTATDNHHWGAAARLRYLLKHGAPPPDFDWPSHRWVDAYRAFDKRYATADAA